MATTEKKRPTKLHFDVSSGLKSVLGSELITDDEVAIFELVKNSFDADARHVDVIFLDDEIVIADNGIGMTFDDIQKKWLFVAYSSKRNSLKPADFRDEISERRHYAGSKGIGRFSSDRLGENVVLQTRARQEKSGPVHKVTVNWNLFDRDHQTHFEKINVSYDEQAQFELPKNIKSLSHGTIISIKKTRRSWDRDGILRLKSGLAKLINPFGSTSDGFTISIFASSQYDEDKRAHAAALKQGEEPLPNTIVNGAVGNFIFGTLRLKTTFLEIVLGEDGKFFESVLTDRGELVYKVREPNPFNELKKSAFRCEIFFLNTSAKMTFARRMGVPSVQFGSIFLFRNGFRVFPIGEEGNDWFGMDHRKQQGYARFLGSRDVIGRIQVSGMNNGLEEASSRNTGLVDSPAVNQLRTCFEELCLKRLERYIVPVTFEDKEDRNTDNISRLLTDPGRARVTIAVAKLVDNSEIELLDYSRRLIGLLHSRSAQFESSLASLRLIAEKTKDRKLFERIETAEERFEELKRSEAEARLRADQERAAKEAAQSRASKAEKSASQAQAELEEERKRSLFLASISTLDTDTILNLHHQVTIYAVDIQQQIENFLVRISDQKSVSVSDVISALESIALLNRKVMGISKFATKANFRLQSERISADLAEYFKEYVSSVANEFRLGQPPIPKVTADANGFVQSFKPIDVTVVIDNLIANAKKAKARNIKFDITHPTKDAIHIIVSDDGRGFDKSVKDLERLFDKGFTTTDGCGLGLHHVRQVLGEMKGTIEARRPDSNGAEFIIRISK